MKKYLLVLLFICSQNFIATAADAQAINAYNKQLAQDFLSKVVDHKDDQLAAQYMANNLVQHSTRIADGLAGYENYLRGRTGGKTQLIVNQLRAAADGDLAIIQSILSNGTRHYSYIHMMRIKDKKIIEYWDLEQALPTEDSQIKTITGGATNSNDSTQTDNNRQLVKDFLNEVYTQKITKNIVQYVLPDMLQHNPKLKQGAAGIVAYIERYKTKNIPFSYVKTHHIIADGDFVWAYSESKIRSFATAKVDIFRLENGKIAEHWNISENIPSKLRHENSAF